ncbi:MAG TPA: GLUG motif-containing protein [Rhizomicrobium sp.]|nr:GLUG motif-containing protein [Rhizomicrobium sp.]
MRHWQTALVLLALCVAAPAQAALKISGQPTKGVSCAAGVCTATAKNAVIAASDLISMLSSGDVTVASGALAKDIEIDAALNIASVHRLTLDSVHDLAVKKPVAIAVLTELTIKTNDGGTNGDLHFFGKGHIEFKDLSASLTINGNSYFLASSIKQILALIARDKGAPFIALAKSFNAGRKTYTSAPIPGYSGLLEGLGNTISNLHITDSTDSCVGLFGCTGNLTPSVRDIGLLNVDIEGSVVSTQSVGAIAGYTHGDIVGAYATGHVSGTGDRSAVGGLLGASVFGTVRYSHSSVAVSGAGTSTAVGSLAGSIIGECIGGTCTGLLDESYATGSVSGGDTNLTGGLVGLNAGGVITNCYATGAVSGGQSSLAGGLIGYSQDNPAEQSVAVVGSAYATGTVTAGTQSSVGGFVGADNAGGHRTALYWNFDTSGITNPLQGSGGFNDPEITGLTTEQLQAGLPSGFSKTYWAQSAQVNSGFPYLAANPPQ